MSETERTEPIERKRVEPIANPETGELVYPWMTADGEPVDSDGYVVEE